jgi:hypothetical protein
MEFFEGLYKGFEAEYYVAGKLFSVGYEAFKLPGDFGFDLIVTNQKEQSIGPPRKGRLLEPPFAVQVKCRSLRPLDFQRGYFMPDEPDRRVRKLMCSLRMLPMLPVGDVLDGLVSQNHLTQDGKRILASELPERVPGNWNASEYIALARGARNAPHELVWRQVPHELFDLRNMGFHIGLGHLN